jgi:glutathione S-transferase
MAESSAIMDHILDQTSHHTLRPEADDPHRARYLFWWHATQGSMMPLQLMATVMGISQKQLPFFLKPFVKLYVTALTNLFIQPRLDRILALAESDLGEAPWFGGNVVSAADFLIAYNMIVGAERDMIDAKRYPRCMEWVQRMKASAQLCHRNDKGRSCQHGAQLLIRGSRPSSACTHVSAVQTGA